MAVADLPSGTVTFLFTDIEGSTALWERDRTAMAAAVERHLHLLRAAIEAHDGVLFKTAGDAVPVAFPTAPGAVAAAVAVQQALQAKQWPVPPRLLRVRMALHAGEGTPDERRDCLAAPLNWLSLWVFYFAVHTLDGCNGLGNRCLRTILLYGGRPAAGVVRGSHHRVAPEAR
jgi:hypothetical protein